MTTYTITTLVILIIIEAFDSLSNQLVSGGTFTLAKMTLRMF